MVSDERSLIDRLEDAQVGSCSCLTKSPDVEHHHTTCRFRLFAEAAQELRERERSFELRWAADMRAIARWRAESPEERELHMPDHADLCVWLLGRYGEPVYQALERFLEEPRESETGWAPFTDQDEKRLHVLLDALARAKWQEDADGDRPLDVTVVNRTRQEPLHFNPLPYLYKLQTRAEVLEYLYQAQINLHVASDIVRLAVMKMKDMEAKG